MKILTSAFVALALSAPIAVSAAGFEGKVAMKLTGQNGREMPMTFNLKSGLARIDVETGGHSFSAIMDSAKQQMTMLMPEQHMYMVRPMPKPAPTTDNKKAEDVGIEKTDEHAKILGYDTTKYVAKTPQGTTEIWVTDQLGTFPGINPGPGRPGRPARQQAWEEAFRGKDAFPLRVVGTSAEGKETNRMEVTSIEKVSLPDSLFAPPADYQEFNMEKMMGGRMGMPGGMHPSAPPREANGGE